VQTSYLNVGTKPEEVKDKKLDESSILPNPELKFVEEWKGQEINTFFCTSETGIKRQDSYRVENDFEGLFGRFNIFIIYYFC